jgi:uncharacterized membrane protein
MDKEKNKSPMVEVVAVTLGILMIVTVMFILFAKESLGLLIPISWAFVVLGIVVAVFQYRLLAGPKDKKR